METLRDKPSILNLHSGRSTTCAQDINQDESTKGTASPSSTDPPSNANNDEDIDGGLLAWSQVLAGHLVAFNAWGYITSYGLFQAYYTATLGQTPSNISWIGSMQIFLTFALSTFSGHAHDTGHYFPIVVAGLALQILAIFVTAQCTTYWQLLLAQGICQGIGNGLAFCPTVSLVSSYFVRKRAMAIAGMASGMSTGGIVFPLIAQQLLPSLGFAWTIRVMGFVILANSVAILLLVRPRPVRGPVEGSIIILAALREPSYVLFGVGMLMAVMGMYFAYYYVTPFAQDIIHSDATTSLSLLLAANAIGLPGRIVPAFLADRFLGPTNVLILVIAISGILNFCWAAVDSLSGTWAFAVVCGFFGASVQSMFPPALASLTADKRQVHGRVSLMFSIISFGTLCGAPIAGALIQRDGGSYLYAQVFVGCIMLCAAVLLGGAKGVRFGEKGAWGRS